MSSTSSQQAADHGGADDGHRALQENHTALLTSNTASAHSKGEPVRDVEIKITNVEEKKTPSMSPSALPSALTNPLRNQTSVVPASSGSASLSASATATLEVGKSGSVNSSYREGNGNTQPGAEKSTSNPYETPQKNKEKTDRPLVAKDKPKPFVSGRIDTQGVSTQGQGNPESSTKQSAQH